METVDRGYNSRRVSEDTVKDSILRPQVPTQPEPVNFGAADVHDGDRHSDVLVEVADLAGLQADGLMLDRSILRGLDVQGVRLPKLELTNVVLDRCNASNSATNESILHRIELIGCRLTGLEAPACSIAHARVRNSSLELANFRFCSFKNVCFDSCILREADFHGADLRGVRFRNCDLRGAQMSSAKLKGTDLRGSEIENLGFTSESLYGVVIDSTQLLSLGWSLAAALGIVVQDEIEEI